MKTIIVTGLARSGTSMMMQILKAGGVPIITDNIRTPNESNPRGYYEVEGISKKINMIRKYGAVKLLSPYLVDIKDFSKFIFIFMQRDLWEVVTSQHKMLGFPYNHDDSKKLSTFNLYRNHLIEMEIILKREKADVIYVDYNKVLEDRQELKKIKHLVKDFKKAIGAVDTQL